MEKDDQKMSIEPYEHEIRFQAVYLVSIFLQRDCECSAEPKIRYLEHHRVHVHQQIMRL